MQTSANKVAIVTGAGSGIGKASALALLKAGFNVVLAGRQLEKLNAVIDQWQGSKNQALACACDVKDEHSVKHLFDTTVAHFGRLDVLFNNAGILGEKLVTGTGNAVLSISPTFPSSSLNGPSTIIT